MAASNPSCDLGRAEEGVAGDDLNGNGYFNGRSGKSFVSDEDEVDDRNNELANNNKQFQDYFSSSKLTRYPWNNHAGDVIHFTQLNNNSAVESSGRSSRSSRSLSGERFPVQQRSSHSQQEDDHTRESSSSSSAALHASTGLEGAAPASPPSEDHFPATVYKGPHGGMPFLFTQPNHIYYPVPESEKLKKMRAGKERKEKLIKKNVKETYQVAKPAEDSEYNVETILESLGENGNPSTDEKKSKKNKPASESGGKKKSTDQTQPQVRKRSNGKESESRQRSSADESEDASDASKDAETERDDSDVEVSVKDKPDKSRSEDNASAKPKAAETNSYRNNSDIKDLIGFSENFVTVNPPESGGSDLKRQTSKSTENLSSFTEVTKKRDRKKKSPTTDDSHDYRSVSGQQPFRPQQTFESRRFNGNNANPRGRPDSTSAASGSIQQSQHTSSGSSTASQESSRSSSTQPTPSSATFVAQNKFLASGPRPNPPPPAFSRPPNHSQPGPQKTGSLDLSSSDFPPLEAEEGAASASTASTGPSSAWPLTRPAASAFFTASPPSGAASTSDHSAVISKTETKPADDEDDSSSVKTLVPGGEWSATSLLSGESSSTTLVPSQMPPDVTKDADLASARHFSLPDIAAQAPLGSVSSGECTPPCGAAGSEQLSSHAAHSDYAECFDREGALSSRHSTASFFVDVDNNVEIVLTEDEYNIRRSDEQCAPVVILGQGETPLEDWTSSSGFEFGFDLNDALLMSSSTSSVPSTLAGGEDLQQLQQLQQHQQPLQAGPQPLDHVDDAIVKFGAPMAFHAHNPHGHYFDMANWHQQHMAAYSQLHSSEAGEDATSGKSTPKAVQLEVVETKASADATTKATKQRRSDYLETVVAINLRWEQVASELKSKMAGVVYFVPDSAQKAVA